MSQRSKSKKRPERKRAMDSFSNPLARLGANTTNMLNATTYPITRLSRDYNLLNSLYRNSWIAKKIVNTIPDDMCKNWYYLEADLTPEVQDRFDKMQQRTKLKERLVEGLYWGRLYGGAAALMLIDGHDGLLDMPLIPEMVMPNSFKGLYIIDRWSGVYPGTEIITDINDPDFGLPKYYEVRGVNGGRVLKVHHSRIIRFEGRKLPFWENQAEIYWGASELEHVFEELSKRDNTSWNIASLVFQSNVLVNKVNGLDQLTAMGDQDAQAEFYNVKRAQNELRNNSAMMVIGENDEMSALQYHFSGLNDIYESFMMDIAGAAEIPVVKLFGRSPAGLNSTGESDMQMYYDMIRQQQESRLMPMIDKLLPIMFMSEFGYVPTDLKVEFNPIDTPSDKDTADLVGKKVEAINTVYNSGILNQKQALKELHQISYTTSMFSSITDEDIENAETSFNGGEDLLGGGLFGKQTMGAETEDRGQLPQGPESSIPENAETNRHTEYKQ